MKQSAEISQELTRAMADTLVQLQNLINNHSANESDLLTTVKCFLLGILSTCVDSMEIIAPGSAPFIYADIEAAAKLGGLNAIKNVQSANGLLGYSVSNIEPDDMTTAMNYMGQELGTALFKAMHELPISLRKPEILLRGIEALLANLLSQKFDSSHQILDSLCEHVHMTLDDLKQRQH